MSVIINYDFDLSVFIFPKGGFKILSKVHLLLWGRGAVRES
jgi:hypothetical protein